MSKLIKKIKVKKQDGTFTGYIPFGGEAVNINVDGESVQVKLNKKPYYYNSVADMKADIKLKQGDTVITLGYYNINDGGRAEYKIIESQYAIDDGGSYHELDNGLFAELIVSNNSINIKQFGAIEDGTTNDYNVFNKAIAYINLKNIKNLILNRKYYLINTMITLNSVNIIGNNATIKFNATASADSYPIKITGYNIKIENLNVDLGSSSYLAAAMRLQNCDGVEIINGYYSHTIDIYSNNKNIKVSNIHNGKGLTARELLTYTTENILFENCIIDRAADPDECCWVVSSNGHIKNVKFVNCNFTHRGGSENCLAVSAYYQNSSVTNILFENCNFDFTADGYRALSFARTSASTSGTTKKVTFRQCNFNITCGTNNRIVSDGWDANTTKAILFDNCNINVTNSSYYGLRFATFKSSNITLDCAKYCIYVSHIDNCNINVGSCETLFAGENIVKNSTIVSAGGLIGNINTNSYGSGNKIEINNCNITANANNLFQINNNTGSYLITNSIINNLYTSSAVIFQAYTVTGDCIISLKNVDLSSGYTKIAGESTYLIVNAVNITQNNNNAVININDLDTNTRRALALNTIILAPSSVGYAYRKISAGDATTDWKIIDAV